MSCEQDMHEVPTTNMHAQQYKLQHSSILFFRKDTHLSKTDTLLFRTGTDMDEFRTTDMHAQHYYLQLPKKSWCTRSHNGVLFYIDALLLQSET